MFMTPVDYWVNTTKLTSYFNPSFARWHGEVLMVYRKHFKSQDSFGVDPSRVGFVWLSKGTFEPLVTSNFVGLGDESIVDEIDNGFNHFQEDPRIFSLRNGSLLLMYSNYHQESRSLFCVVINYNANNRVAEIGPSLHLYHKDNTANEKNWMILETNAGNLLFFQSINPSHIVEIDHVDFETHKAHVKTVYRNHTNLSLPWDEQRYGRIRGGTPAVFVRGLYLSIFHTNDFPRDGFQFHT
jgi:predicted GH43/DUF377 family glycosyl hydrolase